MTSRPLKMSLSGCRRRTPRPQRCLEASSRSWEGMTMTMTSRPLNPTGPDALTKPNPNYGPANWTNFGPDWPKYGPSLSQAHGTLIVTDYPPAHPPYLSPIPSIFVTNTTNIWRQIFVTNTINISVETNM